MQSARSLMTSGNQPAGSSPAADQAEPGRRAGSSLLPHPWLWIGILTIVALGPQGACQGPVALDPQGIDHVSQGAVGTIQEPLLILLAGVLILVGLRAYKLLRK